MLLWSSARQAAHTPPTMYAFVAKMQLMVPHGRQALRPPGQRSNSSSVSAGSIMLQTSSNTGLCKPKVSLHTMLPFSTVLPAAVTAVWTSLCYQGCGGKRPSSRQDRLKGTSQVHATAMVAESARGQDCAWQSVGSHSVQQCRSWLPQPLSAVTLGGVMSSTSHGLWCSVPTVIFICLTASDAAAGPLLHRTGSLLKQLQLVAFPGLEPVCACDTDVT